MMNIKEFPLLKTFPSEAAKWTAQRVLNLTHETAKNVRGNKYDEKRIIWHNVEELQLLYELGAGRYDFPNVNGYVLQCGVFCGGSACVLAKALKDSRQKYSPMVAIDIYNNPGDKERQLEMEFAHRETRLNQLVLDLTDFLYIVVGDDAVFVENFWKGPLRLCFIDSSHSYKHTLIEIGVVLPHVATDGYIVFHDYFNQTEGVRKAVDEFFSQYTAREFAAYNFRDRILVMQLGRKIK